MPRTAPAAERSFPHLYQPESPPSAKGVSVPESAVRPTRCEREFLLGLQRQALQYFLDNQAPAGLVLDRQRNHGPRRERGLCSSSATGMGLIALALASAPPYRLVCRSESVARVRRALETALWHLPHDRGVMPHFVHSATGGVYGCDVRSTIDSAWLVAGGLWAAAFLHDAGLQQLAARLYGRIDWAYWTGPDCGRPPLLRHGAGQDGAVMGAAWDRLNGETAFMYVLAAGGADGHALPREAWHALRPFYGRVAGLRFNNADLGLFVFQYGLDLLDLGAWRAPGEVDLWAEARTATVANRRACLLAARRFETYRRFWGLSAGDGPGDGRRRDAYRCYAPGNEDGTAHLTATLAAVAHAPGEVLGQLADAHGDRSLCARGRYGFSNVNLDRRWLARCMVGIDAGSAVLALDNYLQGGRVRRVFHGLSCVRTGMERIGFRQVVPVRRAS